jgi:type IX secretion system PorP/SprF family membrane protein
MKKIFKLLIILFIPLSAAGQLTPVTNQYILNPLTINPAFAGNRGALNIAAFYRKQWVGIKGAPETMTFAVDAPFHDNKLGLGLIITNDKIGVTKETQFNSNYAYRVYTGKGNLSLGLGAGMVITNTAWSDLVVLDQGDELYLIDSRVFVVPNFSFGAYYSFHNYFAGFSIPKLLSYKFNSDKNKYVLKNDPGDYYFLLNTGYLFDISQNFKFLPSTLVAFSPGDKLLYDINAHFNLVNRLWIGATYRSNRSIVGLVHFQLNNQLKFGYTYEFDFGNLRTYSSGSHEVMIRYEFRYNVEAISPLNF